MCRTVYNYNYTNVNANVYVYVSAFQSSDKRIVTSHAHASTVFKSEFGDRNNRGVQSGTFKARHGSFYTRIVNERTVVRFHRVCLQIRRKVYG